MTNFFHQSLFIQYLIFINSCSKNNNNNNNINYNLIKTQIIVLMLRRLIRHNFGFLKGSNERETRQSNQQYAYEFYRDSKAFSNDTNAIPIDLSKLKLDYMADTMDLSAKVPELKHGLDKFLNGELVFGDQGVGALPQQDKQKRNENISAISGYIEPYKDQMLLQKGHEVGCKYISSTSSISSPLIVLYYLFSCFRLPRTENVYEGMPNKPNNWMISYRKPTSFFLHPLKDGGVDAIVSDKGVMPVDNQVLMDLGHVVQYFLTHTREETDSLMRGEAVKNVNNYYRYARVNNDIMLRSQIDCLSYTPDGKPFVFQIKSRACAPIRYDIQNYQQYTDYLIDTKRGLYQSFQRQYFDLIRGGFLKYVMQVKIGKMDGAFIAYHNTQKIYGYEYVKLKQMALRVFGDQYNLDVSFLCVSKMMTIVLDNIRASMPEFKKDSLKIGFYAEYKFRKLIVIVQPMSVTKQYIPLTQKTDKLKNIHDYFTNYTTLKNSVYKFQFDFFILINGIKLNNSQILLTPHDTLEIKYKVTPRVMISNTQYLMFLNQCYKNQEYYGSYMYRGLWSYVDGQAD